MAVAGSSSRSRLAPLPKASPPAVITQPNEPQAHRPSCGQHGAFRTAVNGMKTCRIDRWDTEEEIVPSHGWSSTRHGIARRNFRRVPLNGDLRASGPQPPKAAIHTRSQKYRRCIVLILQSSPARVGIFHSSIVILVSGQWRNCIDKISVLFYRVWLGNDSVDAACPYRYAVAPLSLFQIYKMSL